MYVGTGNSKKTIGFYEHCGFTAEPVEKTLDMGTPQIVVRYRLTCES